MNKGKNKNYIEIIRNRFMGKNFWIWRVKTNNGYLFCESSRKFMSKQGCLKSAKMLTKLNHGRHLLDRKFVDLTK